MKTLDSLQKIISHLAGYSDDFSDKVLLEKAEKEFEHIVKIDSLNHYTSSKLFISILGLPGSGKTTLSNILTTKYPYLAYLSADRIMESSSFYQDDYAKCKEQAFIKWERISSYYKYMQLNHCINNNLSILLESSGSNFSHVDLYREIEQTGYSMRIFFIIASPEDVRKRIVSRDRFFPTERLQERWHSIRKLLSLLNHYTPQEIAFADFTSLEL